MEDGRALLPSIAELEEASLDLRLTTSDTTRTHPQTVAPNLESELVEREWRKLGEKTSVLRLDLRDL